MSSPPIKRCAVINYCLFYWPDITGPYDIGLRVEQTFKCVKKDNNHTFNYLNVQQERHLTTKLWSGLLQCKCQSIFFKCKSMFSCMLYKVKLKEVNKSSNFCLHFCRRFYRLTIKMHVWPWHERFRKHFNELFVVNKRK